MKTRNKERLFFWGTVTPLVAMLLFTYFEYKDQEALVGRSHKVFNRQIQLSADSYYKQIQTKGRKIKLLENQMIKLEEHHRKEIGECVSFYNETIEELKNK